MASYAHDRDEDIMIMVDSITPNARLALAHDVASYIYSSQEPSMKRVVEIPVELDSKLYGTTQYADWLCAAVTRATHFHFVPGSEFSWAPAVFHSLFLPANPKSRIWIREDASVVLTKSIAHSLPWHGISAPPKATVPRVRKRTRRRGDDPA